MKRMWSKKALLNLIGGGGGLTPTALMEILKGTKYVSVDLSEDEKSVNVEFDFTDIEDFKEELGLNQFVITANVDMSSDPLNPSVEITSENVFEELKAYIIKFQKMPFVVIKYQIGDDIYHSLVKTFRISYSYGSIDGFLLYTNWEEISGIGDEDRQNVMLKVEIDDDSQSGMAKIRFPQHLYQHTIHIRSTGMENNNFNVFMNVLTDNATPINNLTKFAKLFPNGVNTRLVVMNGVYRATLGGTEQEVKPINFQRNYNEEDIKLVYYYLSGSLYLSDSSLAFTDDNVSIEDYQVTKIH